MRKAIITLRQQVSRVFANIKQREHPKMAFRILYRDDFLVAIDKPAGFYVHPPENQKERISDSVNCLKILRNQIQTYVSPVHRLDRATSGVLLFSLDSSVTAQVARQFSEGSVQKTYYALVRGWTDEKGVIDSPLSRESTRSSDAVFEKVSALTEYERVAKIEYPLPLGRYSTARFSLVRVTPKTGRMHQIRRHFAHLRHPIIGDTVYGDGVQNRFFREKMAKSILFLKAYQLEFEHPLFKRKIQLRSRWGGLWHKLFDDLGVCPFEN